MRSRRSHAFAALAVVGFLVAGTGVNGTTARAQTGDLASQFGGYTLASRGNGFLMSFDSPHLLPVASPLFEIGLPEAQATGSNGPSGYALASLAYPGSVVANLPAVLAQGGANVPLPSYPARQESFFPAGPADARQQVATATMAAATTADASDGVADYDGTDLQSFFSMGSVTVRAHTGIEQGQVVSRIHSEISNINILGVVTIASVVTDLVANSNGVDAASDGTTTVSGVKVLGLDATIDADGVHVGTMPPGQPSAPPGVLDPILNGAGLGQLADSLKPIAQALSSLVTSTVGATGTVNDLLQQGGISLKVLQPVSTKNGGQAQRTANGLLIEITYNGKTAPLVSQLLAAVPSDQLPTDPLVPGVPLNTSPQALFNLLKETFITDLALAPGDVAVQASPPYQASPFSGGPGGNSSLGTGGGTTPSFSTAAPRLGTTGTPGTGGSGPSVGDALPIAGAEPYALGLALLGVALIAWLFGFGGGRLADNTLAAANSSCPEGREPPNATYAPGGTP